MSDVHLIIQDLHNITHTRTVTRRSALTISKHAASNIDVFTVASRPWRGSSRMFRKIATYT